MGKPNNGFELDFSLRNFYQWLGVENSLVWKACLDVEGSLGFCSVINFVMGFYNEVEGGLRRAS